MSKRKRKTLRPANTAVLEASPAFADKYVIKSFVARLAWVAALVVLIFYTLGTFYLAAVLPLYSKVLVHIRHGYAVESIRIVDSAMQLDVTVRRQITDESGARFNARRSVRVSISEATAYIQPIILFSILMACPVRSRRRRVRNILLGLPVVILAGLVDIPFILAWEVEDIIAADMPGSLKTVSFMGMELVTRTQESQFLTYWYVFIQTGGRQFLGVLGAILCMMPPQNTQAPRYPSKSQRPTPKQTQ